MAIELDLESPEFTKEFEKLSLTQQTKLGEKLARIQSLSWQGFQQTQGYKWEKVRNRESPSGGPMYSFRLSKKHRALAYRDGNLLRVLSLHLDHDSAYNP